MIRPTLILHMDLDESIYSDNVVTEIKRAYSYVAPTMVKSHETLEGAPENHIRFVVKIHRSYWLSSAEGADELWNEVMLKWLKNMVYKVSSTMVAYNRARRERIKPQLVFDWLEVEFGDLVLAMRLNADCSLEEYGAVEFADHVRALANSGVLAGDIACVRMPSRARYEAQLAAVEAARAEELAGEEAEAGDEAAYEEVEADEGATAVSAEEAGFDEAAEGATDSDELASAEIAEAQESATDALDEAATDEAEAAEEEEAQAEPEREPEPVNFDIDTTVWGIEYVDGTVREFDSKSEAFIS